MKIPRLVLGLHNTEYSDGTFDAERWAGLVAEAGASAVHFEAVANTPGYAARYRSGHLPLAPQLSRDILSEAVAGFHRRGLGIIAYVLTHAVPPEYFVSHPGERQVDRKGNPVVVYGSCHVPCPNSDYRVLLREILREIAGGYEVDGIFMDGPAFFPKTCFCPACRARCGQVRHAPLETLNYLDRLQFKYDSLRAHVDEMTAAVKAVRNIPVYCNGRGLNGFPSYSCNSPARIQRSTSLVSAEAFMYFYDRSPNRPFWAVSGTAKQLRSTAAGRPCLVTATISTRPGLLNCLPGSTLKSISAQAVANGANLWLECSLAVLEQAGPGITELSKFWRSAPGALPPDAVVSPGAAAILWSQAAGDVYDRHPEEIGDWGTRDETAQEQLKKRAADWLDGFYGLGEGLIRSGLPFDIITEENIRAGGLAGYRLLCLPDCGCLSTADCDAIRAFVRAGGALYASYRTSLADENGVSRPDFALADLFGAHFINDSLGGYLRSTGKHGGAAEPGLMISDAACEVRPDSDTEILAVVEGTGAPYVMLRKSGRGRVCFAGSYLELGLWRRMQSTNFEFFRSLMEELVPEPEARIEAGGLPVELTVRKTNGRWYLCLLNYVFAGPNNLSSPVPLSEVRVLLSKKSPVTGAVMIDEQGRRPVSWHDRGPWWELVCENLREWAIFEVFVQKI